MQVAKWGVNSSYHMTPRRDWFTTYRSISGGEVLIRNNMICKVLGTRIKMYDGVIGTSSNVRHMPNFWKNLLSLYSILKGTNTPVKVEF